MGLSVLSLHFALKWLFAQQLFIMNEIPSLELEQYLNSRGSTKENWGTEIYKMISFSFLFQRLYCTKCAETG